MREGAVAAAFSPSVRPFDFEAVHRKAAMMKKGASASVAGRNA